MSTMQKPYVFHYYTLLFYLLHRIHDKNKIVNDDIINYTIINPNSAMSRNAIYTIKSKFPRQFIQSNY